MKSAQALTRACSRTQCYTFSCSKISLPILSHTANQFTTYSPTPSIPDRSSVRSNLHFRPQKNNLRNGRCLSAVPGPDSLRRTALYGIHVDNNATMVPFGGYSMPLQYADLTISESHNWTRNKASLFDVGHMVQHHFKGPGAIDFLEKVTPSSVAGLSPGRSTYSCFLHPEIGGIVDDIVISRPEHATGPHFFHVVSNAGSREKVHTYLTKQLQDAKKIYGEVSWNVSPDQGLIALQGPLSAQILQEFLGSEGYGLRFQPNLDLNTFYFGQVKVVTVEGLPNEAQAEVMISRGGYTGEDGFELSIPPAYTATITEHLLRTAGPERLRLAGLGARDSLRLEAGLCLYGQDLDDSTTPVEASIGWIVHPDRRTNRAGFHGSSVILRQLERNNVHKGPLRRRVGLIVGSRPARAGAKILTPNIVQSEASELPGALGQSRKLIGTVTSGCPSPTLGQNIAMGYVARGYAKPGTELRVMVGGKEREAAVVKMPFVKANRWSLKDTPRPVEEPKPTENAFIKSDHLDRNAP